MADYTEKRSYKRVKVECNIQYKMLDSDVEENEVGQLENISGRGLMFIAERGVPLNAELEIRVEPGNDLTPPLHARVQVVRMEKQRKGGGYEIGAVIRETYE
ncbi:MAG: PilZ domain-containing protein [Gammaproteobacteria bacterium]|nr:PilZ domain-containing protein [Gammaproteobacteria bacterium]